MCADLKMKEYARYTITPQLFKTLNVLRLNFSRSTKQSTMQLRERLQFRYRFITY